MAWLYMPDMPASTSGLVSPCLDIELFVTLSGKQVARPISWRGWQRRNYIKLLFGTIAAPSMATLGAARWISSLRVSRAQKLALPESARAYTVNGGFGTMSPELFARYDQGTSFLKTSEGSFLSMMDLPSVKFSETWPAWGLMRGGDVYRLPALVPATNASVSRSWPTPMAADDGHKVTMKSHQRMLMIVAGEWATPKTITGGANSTRAARGAGGADLQEQVSNWATPVANDAEKRGAIAPEMRNGLTGMVADFQQRRLRLLMTKLGLKSLKDARPRLSPQFTEWMMGLPKGWTDYENAETGFTRWQQHMRGELDKLSLPRQLVRGPV